MSHRHERQHLYKLGRNICTLSEKKFDTKWYIQDNHGYGIFKKHMHKAKEAERQHTKMLKVIMFVLRA